VVTKVRVGIATVLIGGGLAGGLGMPSATQADNYVFDDVEKGLVSLGGRATYFEHPEPSPKW